VSAFAENLKRALKPRFEINPKVESLSINVDSVKAFKLLARTIQEFETVQIFYDGSFSFWRSVVPAVLISRFYGKRTALYYYPERSDDKVPGFHRLIMKWCEKVFVGTEYQKRELSKYNTEAEVLYPPVDLTGYAARVISKVQPRLLIIHDDSENTATETAVRAFKIVKQKYPRTEMTIITNEDDGKDLMVNVMMEQIPGIEFMVTLNPDSYASIFKSAEIFLNCSYNEAPSTALVAAMCAGMPVISFETYGAREIIQNGVNGFLTRHSDHNRIADRIIELIEQAGLCQKISSEASKMRGLVAAESFCGRVV
jgi:glycosyltransferase involved in cell wall biosynthesis